MNAEDTKRLKYHVRTKWKQLEKREPLVQQLEYWRQQATSNRAAMTRFGDAQEPWATFFKAGLYEDVKNNFEIRKFVNRARNGYKELWWLVGGLAENIGVVEYAQQITVKLCMAWMHQVYFEYGTELMTDKLWCKQAFTHNDFKASAVFASTNKEMAWHLLKFKNRYVKPLMTEVMLGDAIQGHALMKSRLDAQRR